MPPGMNEHSFIPSGTTLTVDHLLDAALATFDEVGYSAAPVPAIAERAGVAVGSLYRHFPGKEALANALYRREKQRLATALFDGVQPDEPAAAVFATVWDRLTEHALQHAEALCFLELHHHGAYLDDTSRRMAHEIDRSIADLLERWQTRGEIRSGDPFLLHVQVFGGFVAVLRQLRLRSGGITRDIDLATRGPAWALLSPNERTTHSGGHR